MVFSFAVVYISWFNWFLFFGVWCCLYKCKLGSYYAGSIWNLFAKRLVWDDVFHARILQGCGSPNLAPSTSTQTIWQGSFVRGLFSILVPYYFAQTVLFLNTSRQCFFIGSDTEEAWGTRGWLRSLARDAWKRYWSTDSLCTRGKGNPFHRMLLNVLLWYWIPVLFKILNFLWLSYFHLLCLWKSVKQYLGYFPWIQLSATVSPITRTVLKVIPWLIISSGFCWSQFFCLMWSGIGYFTLQ